MPAVFYETTTVTATGAERSNENSTTTTPQVNQVLLPQILGLHSFNLHQRMTQTALFMGPPARLRLAVSR